MINIKLLLENQAQDHHPGSHHLFSNWLKQLCTKTTKPLQLSYKQYWLVTRSMCLWLLLCATGESLVGYIEDQLTVNWYAMLTKRSIWTLYTPICMIILMSSYGAMRQLYSWRPTNLWLPERRREASPKTSCKTSGQGPRVGRDQQERSNCRVYFWRDYDSSIILWHSWKDTFAFYSRKIPPLNSHHFMQDNDPKHTSYHALPRSSSPLIMSIGGVLLPNPPIWTP